MGVIESNAWKVVFGLILTIFGLFVTFFVKTIPLSIGVVITIAGFLILVYYLFKTIFTSIRFLKKNKDISFINICKDNCLVLISIIFLSLILISFVSASNIQDGTISIEQNSRKVILYTSDSSSSSITEEGPFTVDSAFENESNIIRMPYHARETLSLSINDTLHINGTDYIISDGRDKEPYILRLPVSIKNSLNLSDGDIIRNIHMPYVFNSSSANHFEKINDNVSIEENFIIVNKGDTPVNIKIAIDGDSIYSSDYYLSENNTYNLAINGSTYSNFRYNGTNFEDSFDYKGKNISFNLSESSNTPVKYLKEDKSGSSINLII